MFAKDLSNKIFSPQRHEDTKLKYNKQFFFVSWCLCGHSFRFIQVRIWINITLENEGRICQVSLFQFEKPLVIDHHTEYKSSFHPEMALFRNLCVNPPEAGQSAESLVSAWGGTRNFLISLHPSGRVPGSLDLAKNCSFLNWKLLSAFFDLWMGTS